MFKRIIKKYLNRFKKKSNKTFYEDLFITNPKWNESIPNRDEMFRWVDINGHIQYILSKEENIALKILDVGAGRGWLTNLLSRYGEAVGVEPDSKVTEYAKQLFPNISFYNSDFLSFNVLGIHQFDLLVSSEVIEHIEIVDRKEFVLKMKANLRPFGYIIISTPRKEIESEWISKYGTPGQPLENWFYQGDLIQLFTNRGFILLNQTTINLPFLKISEAIYQTYLFQKSS
jgi:2-polyprenyl-3-methyl-5-hydroxy-6-metoxy-1,4-benzoquinol methylase